MNETLQRFFSANSFLKIVAEIQKERVDSSGLVDILRMKTSFFVSCVVVVSP